MQYAMLALGTIGLVVSAFWVRRPENKKDLFYAIVTMTGAAVMLATSLYMLLNR